MTNSKEAVIREVEDLPSSLVQEVLDFIRFLKTRVSEHKLETTILSESALRKDWLRSEEDEAWGNL